MLCATLRPRNASKSAESVLAKKYRKLCANLYEDEDPESEAGLDEIQYRAR